MTLVYSRPMTVIATEDLDLLRTENAALKAQIATLKADYAAEVDEMNAGYGAYIEGESINDEPPGNRFDVWRIGWAWAKYNTENDLSK